MAWFAKYLLVALVISGLFLAEIEGKKKSKKSKKNKQMILRQKETNAVEFIRLAVMRLIYGIATRVGLGEQISDALNGAFIPPGVDDDYSDDYGGGGGGGAGGGFGGLFDREDDYDYR